MYSLFCYRLKKLDNDDWKKQIRGCCDDDIGKGTAFSLETRADTPEGGLAFMC